MPLTTTTIGAYPKPKQTPIQDWFLGTKSEEEKKAAKGLLANWSPGAYEKAIEKAGDNVENLFLDAIKEVIIDQVNAGIDVPTDGEVRRESYVLYQCRFLNGVSFKEVTHKSVRQGAFEADLPTIVAPISSKEIRMYLDWKSAQQFTKNPVKITLPGPMTITDSIANNYYDDMKKLGFDLALALNKEVKALVDAGCKYIQIDEPVFARKPEEANSYGMENLERMMHGIPKDVQRVCHICCGYPNCLDSDGYKKALADYDKARQSGGQKISSAEVRENIKNVLGRDDNPIGAAIPDKDDTEGIDEAFEAIQGEKMAKKAEMDRINKRIKDNPRSARAFKAKVKII